MRTGRYDERELERQLDSRGLMNRFLGRLTRAVSQAAADVPGRAAVRPRVRHRDRGRAAGPRRRRRRGAGLPWYAILCLPILFAAGMSLMDTIDGSFMNFAYGWAFSKPVRKVFYNLTITGLSVAVALRDRHDRARRAARLELASGSFWSWFENININVLGFVIVGMFVATWAIALVDLALRAHRGALAAHLRQHGGGAMTRRARRPVGSRSPTSTRRSSALRERGLRLSTSRRLVLARAVRGRRPGVGRAARARARARADLGLPQPRDARAPRPRPPRPPRPRPGPVRLVGAASASTSTASAAAPSARSSRGSSTPVARGGPKLVRVRGPLHALRAARHLRAACSAPLARQDDPQLRRERASTSPSSSATVPAPARSISSASSRHARATGATRAVGPHPIAARSSSARARTSSMRQLAERPVRAADEDLLARGSCSSRAVASDHACRPARRARAPPPGRRRSRRRRPAAARAPARAGPSRLEPGRDRLEQPAVLEHAARRARPARCRAAAAARDARLDGRRRRARVEAAAIDRRRRARGRRRRRPRGSSRADRAPAARPPSASAIGYAPARVGSHAASSSIAAWPS